MAKITELTDKQLMQALAKYKSEFSKTSEPAKQQKIKALFLKLKDEKLRRGRTDSRVSSETPSRQTSIPMEQEGSDLSSLMRSADQSVRARKVEQSKRNKFTEHVGGIKKTRLTQLQTNIMLGGGLALSAVTTLLLVDYYYLEWVLPGSTSTVPIIVLLVLGLTLSKVAMVLSDDDK